MMLFWIVIGLLLAATLALLARSVFGGGDIEETESDIALYKRQLEELDRDLGLGVINEAEAKTAQLELERRILKVADAAPSMPLKTDTRVLPLTVLAVIPLLALALYWQLGRPGLPGASFDPGLGQMAEERQQSIEEAVAGLEKHLEQNPQDVEGWALLATTFVQMQRIEEARSAYQKAVALRPNSALLQAGLGEVLVIAAQGTVTDAAQAAFAAALLADPGEPRARFYGGLATYQKGDGAGALEQWKVLARSSPPNAPWLPMLFGQIEKVAGELGLDGAAIREEISPQGSAPSRDDMKVLQSLPTEDQVEAIGQMVEGLTTRLENEPDDLEGWRMLARSYEVLGRTDEAQNAYAHLAKKLPGDIAVQMNYARVILTNLEAQRKPIAGDVVSVLETILGLEETNAFALLNLGKAARSQGDETKAQSYWMRVLSTAPPSSSVYIAAKKLSEEMRP